jgi:hypothetical protein
MAVWVLRADPVLKTRDVSLLDNVYIESAVETADQQKLALSSQRTKQPGVLLTVKYPFIDEKRRITRQVCVDQNMHGAAGLHCPHLQADSFPLLCAHACRGQGQPLLLVRVAYAAV